MKIKNSLVLIVFALFLFGTKLKAQTVYVTETGKKYHAKNCDIVKTGKKGIELTEAKKKGLEPCKSCKVETTTKTVADKPKTTTSKK
jgi:hypothetical protein